MKTLEGLGCTVQEVAISEVRHSRGAAFAILAPEAMAYHEPLLRQHASEYAPEIRQRVLVGRFLSATDYIKRQRARVLIRRGIDAVLQGVDCLLAPTVPIPAPPVTATEVLIGDRTETPRWALSMFTHLFNVTGHPVIAVPCGFSRGGLPLSLQFIGRMFDEMTILRLGDAYEGATEWHTHRPCIA